MRKIKVLIISLILSVLSGQILFAQQNADTPKGYVITDSVIYRPAAAVDTLLAGKDIFHVMPSRDAEADAGVVIHQTPDVEAAVRRQIASNAERQLNGFRVRIFFDNKQTARVESEETLKRFESLYHDVVAYRTYANPYFKVTVGDFRTKSEAVQFLERIKKDFPSAFVVRENIEYPVADKENAYITDTVRVMRKISQAL